MRCSQCENRAMYEVEGHPLCLRCAKTWEDMLRGQRTKGQHERGRAPTVAERR